MTVAWNGLSGDCSRGKSASVQECFPFIWPYNAQPADVLGCTVQKSASVNSQSSGVTGRIAGHSEIISAGLPEEGQSPVANFATPSATTMRRRIQ